MLCQFLLYSPGTSQIYICVCVCVYMCIYICVCVYTFSYYFLSCSKKDCRFSKRKKKERERKKRHLPKFKFEWTTTNTLATCPCHLHNIHILTEYLFIWNSDWIGHPVFYWQQGFYFTSCLPLNIRRYESSRYELLAPGWSPWQLSVLWLMCLKPEFGDFQMEQTPFSHHDPHHSWHGPSSCPRRCAAWAP